MEDFFLFGIFLPLSFGLMLFFLVYTGREQARASHGPDNRLQAAEVPGSHSEDWARLAESIVEFPQSLGPVSASALHVYNWEEKRFEFAAQRQADETTHVWDGNQITPEICNSCEFARTAPSNFISCRYLSDTKTGQATYPYCLPVLYENKPVALLHLDFPIEQMEPNGEILVLERIAPEMALVIQRASSPFSVAFQMNKTGTQVQTMEKDLYRLRKGDIEATLLEYARAAGTRSRFKVRLISEGDPCTLTSHARRQILFICQEAINNIEQHAQAHHVKIHLNWQANELMIIIGDDGRGFDATAALASGQSGLSLMGERAEEIKGRISLASSRQTGTEVILRVPLQAVDWLPDLKAISLSANAWNTGSPGLPIAQGH